MRRSIRATILAVLAVTALSAAGTAVAAQPGQVRAAFFANWDRYARGYCRARAAQSSDGQHRQDRGSDRPSHHNLPRRSRGDSTTLEAGGQYHSETQGRIRPAMD